MINYIQIKNFKGYKSLKLNFSDALSILTGKNNAGKTTILEAFLIFQESYDFTLQILERKAKKVSLKAGEYYFKENFLISFNSVRSQDYYELFYKNETNFEIEIGFDDITIKFEIKKGRGGTAYNIIPKISDKDLIKLNRDYNPKNFFYTIKSSSIYSIAQYEPKYSVKMVEKLSLEGNKQGTFRNRLLAIKEKNKLVSLQNYMESIFSFNEFKLHIDFDENSDLYIKVYFSTDIEPKQDIALLGSGTLQIMEVLMSILLSKDYKNKLILLDEPDSHLHRDIQKVLLENLRFYSNNGFQIILTTHNEQIIALANLKELLHLYCSAEDIEIKSIGEQIIMGRQYGFSSDKKTIYQDLGIPALSMNFIEAIESDRIVIIEGKDKQYIEKLEQKRRELFPVNSNRKKVVFWSLNGVANLDIKIKRIKTIFEIVNNRGNLLSKTVLLLDRDYRFENEIPKFDTLTTISWNSYTIESIFLENIDYLRNFIFNEYIKNDNKQALFNEEFNNKIDELSDMNRYKNKISSQREQNKLHKSIEYLTHLENISNRLHLIARKDEFQELLSFINSEFDVSIPELEIFLIQFIDNFTSEKWNKNWSSVLQQIYGD